ncbi:hypothetical protein sscle_14g101730 [Sclerotinia sclerotiorum 1980 UF-70]|uniref:Uncharacterized protein n=1 Tax=Sclerotinia sclerotiorum (strain ATCC 18683 / 1980 / Ss-1) TaxID=665079 RepID=A0A1D9QLD6_SCLS1|nr:hypothetical protein sscle_14g101730 [Sclerotinia sclerotiorum 1980 UF-70]
MGASSAFYLMIRAGLLDGTESASTFLKDAQDAKNNTLAEGIIENLVFAESKSVRTSTVILAAFNVLASFATAASILYDSYWASKRCNPKFKASQFCVSMIHPAETFPLVLSIGIVIQGIIFAAVQGEGLNSLFTSGCSIIAQFMWIALFIVPYIQLVFGLECAIRSLRKTPFQSRGKYDVTICLGTILLMLIGTWLPTNLFPENNRCFASFLWFVSKFGNFGFILFSAVAGLLIIASIIIFVRLSRTALVERNQRIAASRMVYYLLIGVVSLSFVIPYFASQTIGHGDLKLAMMATVVLNLSGLMNGLLQLFLRSNTATASFGPKGRSCPNNKHEIRIWGPNELAFNNQIMDPVQPPVSPWSGMVSRADSQKSSISPTDKSAAINKTELPILQPPMYSPTKANSQRFKAISSITSTPAPQTPTESFPSEHTRKQSYSLFPAPALQSPNTLLPPRMNRSAFESVYDISDLSDLEAPPSLQGKRGHRRGSSVASSATVQIGIRFSHAPPPPAVPGMLPIAVPSSTDKASGLPASTFQALALPPTTYAPTSKFNPATQTTSAPPRILLPPIKTTNLAKNIIPIPPRSPFRPSVDTNTATQQFPKRSNPSRINSPQQSPSYINKTLPATPKPIAPKQPAIERLEQSKAIIQLSPTVYTPPKSLLQRNGSAKAVLPGSDFNRRDSKFGQASRDQWI